MRSVLWILVLLALCAALWSWNVRITTHARAEREELRHGRLGGTDLPEGFGRAVIGEASGAPFVDPPAPVSVDRTAQPHEGVSGHDGVSGQDGGSGRDGGSGADQRRPAPAPGGSREHVVAAGESLSSICQREYGTAHPDVVAAVARANHIEKIDQIRAGTKIVLPPASAVVKDKR